MEANMVDVMSKMQLQEYHSANLEERAIQIPSTKEEALEDISQGIFRITLQDMTPNPTSDGMCARGNNEHIMSSTFMPVQPMPSTAAHENNNFTMLVSLDHDLHTHTTHALELVKDLDSQGAQRQVLDTMREEELWLEGCNEMLQVVMIEKVDQILAAIKSISTTLTSRTKEDPALQDHAAATVETGS
ncbi:hypothetical protein PAXRUDRAFT_36846 [Paxillus rubicundulus Ve08.2h10]|uniref:Uncharacterized protein n=1 Tax=Paxillus rubicundulus Ve08.2h10 TaxID=930991 RepID=A0A0D0C1A5_9AGAM|nr:hypothetical protein PAXRUDRAFT_36846 [Paxillus rubicundulus Ve08.2h10]